MQSSDSTGGSYGRAQLATIVQYCDLIEEHAPAQLSAQWLGSQQVAVAGQSRGTINLFCQTVIHNFVETA